MQRGDRAGDRPRPRRRGRVDCGDRGLVPTGRSVVLAYTTPFWVTPGASLFLGEPLTPRRAAGVIVGVLGLGVLFNPVTFDWTDRDVVLGHLAILAAALLLGRQHSPDPRPPMALDPVRPRPVGSAARDADPGPDGAGGHPAPACRSGCQETLTIRGRTGVP